MKFDYIIGNPPYQDDQLSSTNSLALPIYDKFIDASYELSECVELIHPARFLFNAGGTSKAWNKKMLNDPHLKVLNYFPISGSVFPNTDIKGGVAITIHNTNAEFGKIGIYTKYDELDTILKKVTGMNEFESFSAIVGSQSACKLTKKLHEDHPDFKDNLCEGGEYSIASNIFQSLPSIFFNERPDDENEYIQILGRENNSRVYKWVKKMYVNSPSNYEFYKVILPKVNGTGAFGEVLSSPVIGQPKIVYTGTFIAIGCFKTENEAEACLKYIKTRFARTLLDILKITQDNLRSVWQYVPMQDFTNSSDIDWTKSVSEIDQQLYKKYGLSKDEIEFIESHVKEME